MIKDNWFGIAAVDEKNGLGFNGSLPWSIKDDLKWFCQKTKDSNILVGRRTFLSMPPLWGRKVFVLSKHHKGGVDMGSTMVFDNNRVKFEEVVPISFSKEIPSKCWVAGGKSVYDQFLPLCKKLYLTRIKNIFKCDTFLNKPSDHFDLHSVIRENDQFKIELWLNKNI